MQTLEDTTIVASHFDNYDFSYFGNQGGCGHGGHGSWGWPCYDFYNNLSHTCDTCYKLNGYPNYHGGTKKLASNTNHAANNESPLGPFTVP